MSRHAAAAAAAAAASEPTINIPFRCYVPAGTSNFEIAIPEQYRNRRFTFSHVLFMAEFYNNQAAQMDLDTDFELDEEMEYMLKIHIPYPRANGLYQGTFNQSEAVHFPPEFVHEFNNFFELNKPLGMASLGAFIDWSDTRLKDSDYTLKEWVEEIMAEEYYDEPYNPDKHFNELPVSARTLSGVNNYAIPRIWSDSLKQHLTYRIHLAPNTNFLFSNGIAMNDLGFSADRLGARKSSTVKFVMRNSSKNSYFFLESDIQSQHRMTVTPNKFNALLRVNALNFISEEFEFNLSRKNLFSNAEIEKQLAIVFRRVERSANIRIGVLFDKVSSRFQFQLPQNANFHGMSVVTEPAFLQRIGFGLVGEIGFHNQEGNKIIDTSDIKDAREKATAVANDAGILVITNENSSSGNTVGVYESNLADLYPVSEGKMELRAAESCSTNSALQLAGYMPSVNGYVNARLKLWRFVDRGPLVACVLKMGSWVIGSLRSI